jgi:hypothetical protein
VAQRITDQKEITVLINLHPQRLCRFGVIASEDGGECEQRAGD